MRAGVGAAAWLWVIFSCTVAEAQAGAADVVGEWPPWAGWIAFAAFLFSCTSYIKISIVLSVLKNACGLRNTPSAAVVGALSIALSAIVMLPVIQGVEAAVEEEMDPADPGLRWSSITAALQPLEEFLRANSGTGERELVNELAARRAVSDHPPPDLVLLIPSFMLTELSEAFQIAILIILPFLVLDLFVAIVLRSLSLEGMRTETVSLPFKLMLFVGSDGWQILTGSLILGYA